MMFSRREMRALRSWSAFPGVYALQSSGTFRATHWFLGQWGSTTATEDGTNMRTRDLTVALATSQTAAAARGEKLDLPFVFVGDIPRTKSYEWHEAMPKKRTEDGPDSCPLFFRGQGVQWFVFRLFSLRSWCARRHIVPRLDFEHWPSRFAEKIGGKYKGQSTNDSEYKSRTTAHF